MHFSKIHFDFLRNTFDYNKLRLKLNINENRLILNEWSIMHRKQHMDMGCVDHLVD